MAERATASREQGRAQEGRRQDGQTRKCGDDSGGAEGDGIDQEDDRTEEADENTDVETACGAVR